MQVIRLPYHALSRARRTAWAIAGASAWWIVYGSGARIPANAQENPTAARTETLRRYGLDLSIPPESRIGDTPDALLKVFQRGGAPSASRHLLTSTERQQLAGAFAELPPVHKQILTDHLRSITFLDGILSTALTSPVNPGEPYPLFDITIRAGILNQTATEWLTEKEQTCFDFGGSSVTISIEAGKRDALLYVLLHEATHVVDFCLNITPAVRFGEPRSESPPAGDFRSEFTEGIWTDRLNPSPIYRDPLRQRVRFYASSQKIPVSMASALYKGLSQTPFVSLYGSTNCNDDLAEYVTVFHWTEKLRQPYRITVRDRGKTLFTYDPMKSKLVRGRADQMQRFYEKIASANLAIRTPICPTLSFNLAGPQGRNGSYPELG